MRIVFKELENGDILYLIINERYDILAIYDDAQDARDYLECRYMKKTA